MNDAEFDQEVRHALDRAAFVAGLRALADYLESTPLVRPTSGYYDARVGFVVRSREEMAAMARTGAWRKVPNSGYFSLERDFGPVVLDVFTERQNVCRKVTTGTRIVPARPAEPEREEPVEEWVCDEALLAPDAAVAEAVL